MTYKKVYKNMQKKQKKFKLAIDIAKAVCYTEITATHQQKADIMLQ